MIYMYQNKYNNLRILELYSKDYTKKIYLREISKLSNLPLRNVQVILDRLEKEKVLKTQFSGRNKYFYLNLESIETKYLILKSEIYKTIIFIKGYPQFNAFLKEVKNIESCIIVFGSFAQLVADKNSDMDILIISNKKTDLPYHLIPNKIHEINLSKKNFIKLIEKEDIFIKKIQEKHVILNNHSFFVNIFWRKYAK